MAQASFRATVSPKMGSFQMAFRALGVTYGKEVRADADPSPNDVSAVVRSMATNKKCVFFWNPPDYPKNATVFKDAMTEKSVVPPPTSTTSTASPTFTSLRHASPRAASHA